MPNAEALLDRVCRALEALIQAAEPYGGLWPSLLDRKTLGMLEVLPPAIEGQRQGDRSHLGSNLMHDQAALKTLYALATALDKPAYAEAADGYLRRFVDDCATTPSGLFPWGEHAFWHLRQERVGDSGQLSRPDKPYGPIHDHLRQAPVWLLDKLHRLDPACIQRLADGLDNHWTDGEGWEYIRHAVIMEADRRHPRGARSCDFPRHGGFFVLDWAVAWRYGGQAAHLQQIRRMVDYWWPRRDGRDLLLIESRTPEENDRFYDINAPGQTLSLAASLLEAAPILQDGQADLAATMRQRAGAYIDAFLRAPHELAEGVFSILSKRSDNQLYQAMPVWGSVYGVWPASYVGLTALCAYRLTGDARLLDWAAAVGRCYAHQPLPEGVAVPAMDAGLGLGLLADLYDITEEPPWLEAALGLAGALVDGYMDAELPRGALGIDWYESQMGPSFLLHGLARTALLAGGRADCPLTADYTAR